jgi:hypothetical protein
MRVQLEGLFKFELNFPKKEFGLPYNDKILNGPNEQLWIRECILKDFLMAGKDWTIESSKNEIVEGGHCLYNIKVTAYEIKNNQYEFWLVELN